MEPNFYAEYSGIPTFECIPEGFFVSTDYFSKWDNSLKYGTDAQDERKRGRSCNELRKAKKSREGKNARLRSVS